VRQGDGLSGLSSQGASLAVRTRLHGEAVKPLQVIADLLNDRGAPTANGGDKWHASTVRAVLGEKSEHLGDSSAGP
jgi:hypothetical protein